MDPGKVDILRSCALAFGGALAGIILHKAFTEQEAPQDRKTLQPCIPQSKAEIKSYHHKQIGNAGVDAANSTPNEQSHFAAHAEASRSIRRACATRCMVGKHYRAR